MVNFIDGTKDRGSEGEFYVINVSGLFFGYFLSTLEIW